MNIDDEALIFIYGEGTLTPEKMAASDELRKVGAMYRFKTNDYQVTDNDLLQRLLDLRKMGKLPRRTARERRVVEPSWGELEDGAYTVTIDHKIDRQDIIDCLYQWHCRDENELPLTRAETLEIVIEVLSKGLEESGLTDRVAPTVDRLFPELKDVRR